MSAGLTATAQKIFGRPWFETVLGGLILLSVALTVVETTSKPEPPAGGRRRSRRSS